MKTSQPVSEAPTLSSILAQYRRLMAIVYIGLTLGTVLMYVTGYAAMSEPNGHTSILHGWNHGFYVIPGFVASLFSSEYSVYQAGGGAIYNIGYVAGFICMVRCFSPIYKK